MGEDDRLRRVIEASPTALILVAQCGRIERANARAEGMFGYARDEMRGRQIESLLPQRFRDAHVTLRHGFQGNSAMRQMGAGRALFGLRKDGSEFPLEAGLSPLTLDGMQMVLAGVTDMTLLHAAARDLERSIADQAEFAHIASHDLKAPLRALGHLADWISEDVQATASAETMDNLRLLKGRVSRLQILLDGLLLFARVGRGSLPPEEVDAAEMVCDIAALHGAFPRFEVVFDGPERSLHAHRAPLRAVFEHLIGNVIKHHDRAAGQIRIGMRRISGMVEFSVADDGPGIASRFHERVFKIFQTLASSDDREASGMGLAIVKKLVVGQGGTVHIESDPPLRGTKFVFTWQEHSP